MSARLCLDNMVLIWISGIKTWLTEDISVDTRYPGNSKVSNEVICYIAIPNKMSLRVAFGVNTNLSHRPWPFLYLCQPA